MKSFIAQHRDSIIGVLSGFDRLVLRGHLRALCYVGGMLRSGDPANKASAAW